MFSSEKDNYFKLPNQIFNMGLSPGELAVYAYLKRCCNIRTGECWPSYKRISQAVGVTKRSVPKYVELLIDKHLIQTESTSLYSRKGLKGNGTLKYTLLPIEDIQKEIYQKKLQEVDLQMERIRAQERLKKIQG